MYSITIAAVLAVLALSATTGFADLPRLCRIVAQDDYLPHAFRSRGRRLAFSQGIYVLTVLAAVLLSIFGGITDRLIPLFAVGAFLAFTLSQLGMVAHWRRRIDTPDARRNMVINGVGAAATGVTLLVVLVSKLTEGAWITLLMLPILMLLFSQVRRHYVAVARETASVTPLDLAQLQAPIVVVPIEGWSNVTRKSLRFALKLSPEVEAIFVAYEEEAGRRLQARWAELVVEPALAAGCAPPTLTALYSPYRRLLVPLLDHIQAVERSHPDRQTAVVVSALVEHHWYHYVLHNQTATALAALLVVRGDRRIVMVNVPWYLKS